MTKGTFTRGSRKQARNRSDQEGSILIAASVFLLVGVILLGAIQIGYMYYTKRELQKTADLAALTGVQSLWRGCDEANGAKATAIATANQNFSGATITATCGAWNGDGQNAAGTTNALTVEASAPASPFVPFFKSGRTITAQAQAVTSPVAAFSVGSRLLRVDSGLLSAILLGVGLDPTKLTVLDSNGISNINLTPSGLLSALGLPASIAAGVGTPQQLTDLQDLTLGKLLSATATLIGPNNDDLSTAISLLKASSIGANHVNLFGKGGILALPQNDLLSALNTNINVGTLIKTALVVANANQAIQLTVPSTPALAALLTGPVKLTVVNPPDIAVGGIGTKAQNSQVQVSIPLSLGVKVLGLSLLSLPISINLNAATSVGVLNDICAPPMDRNEADIGVTSTLAGISALIAYIPVSLPVGESYESNVKVWAPGQKEVSQPTLGIDNLITALISGILGQGLGSALSAAVLQPLLKPLDGLLTSVLNLLGLDVNLTDVTLYSVQCASPRLVQ